MVHASLIHIPLTLSRSSSRNAILPVANSEAIIRPRTARLLSSPPSHSSAGTTDPTIGAATSRAADTAVPARRLHRQAWRWAVGLRAAVSRTAALTASIIRYDRLLLVRGIEGRRFPETPSCARRASRPSPRRGLGEAAARRESVLDRASPKRALRSANIHPWRGSETRKIVSIVTRPNTRLIPTRNGRVPAQRR